MESDPKLIESLQPALAALKSSQFDWILAVIRQFQQPFEFQRNETSDLIAQESSMGSVMRFAFITRSLDSP
jgi:hypothetical protein